MSVIAALVAASLLVPADTEDVTRRAAGRTCGADSLYARVPVYVRVTVANRADTAAAQSLVLLAQSVATRVRARLSGAPDSVPRGDSLFFTPRRDSTKAGVWHGGIDSAGLRVVARRDGTLRWSAVRSPVVPITTLLDAALADAKQADETFIPPESFTADSIPFTLGYDERYDVVRGRMVARAAGLPTLVAFTRRVGLEKTAATIPGTLRAQYPDGALSGRAEGHLVLQFVVDTAGRADMTTVHDIWPADRPRLTGELGDHYDAFVRSATEGVRRARFYPAEIAGCRVKQLVRLPFSWSISR